MSILDLTHEIDLIKFKLLYAENDAIREMELTRLLLDLQDTLIKRLLN